MTKLTSGQIYVNGLIIKDSNYLVSSHDQILVNKTRIHASKRLYFKFNKPTDVISTYHDPNERRDLSFFIKKSHLPTAVRPCGRLDRHSSGLLLFSNDGQFIHRVLHPNFSTPKAYEIKLNRPIHDDHIKQLNTGIFLRDGPVSMAIDPIYSPTHFMVTISMGRNRILRRSFEFFGYEITFLHRQSIGPISLGKLPVGHFEKIPPPLIKKLVQP